MGNISCKIIKDLLPSYVDGICSKETEDLIEEHILKCNDCCRLMNHMKMNKIVSVKSHIENNYLTKIKRIATDKNLISLGLMIGFIIIGMILNMYNISGVPPSVYYVILPILTLGTYSILSNFALKKSKTRWFFAVSSLGMFLIFYIIILEFLIVKWVENGTYLFGMSAAKIGVFVYYQLWVVAIAHMITFVVTIFLSVKDAASYSMSLPINITGSCLALAFISMSKGLYSIEAYATTRNNTILVLVIEGVLVALIVFILDRRKIQLRSS